MEELKKCPFCGGKENLQILNQGDCVHLECHYTCDIDKGKEFAALAYSWFVNCPDCGTCGPIFYVGGEFGKKTDDECKESAIEAWNNRA